MRENRSTAFLDLAAYSAVFAIGLVGILEIETVFRRWWALGILVLMSVFIYSLTRLPLGDSTHRANLLLGLLAALETLLLWLYPNSRSFPTLFFVLCPLAFLTNRTRAGILWTLLFIAILGVFLVGRMGWSAGLQSLLSYSSGFLFFGIAANALRRASLARQESERLLAELSRANRQLQEYARQVETMAVHEERIRMAREMHDTIGHRLTVAAVQLEAAQRLIPSDPERAARMTGTVREQVRAALAELRQTVARLREPLEAELPFDQALQQLTASFQEATGLRVHLSLPPEAASLPIPVRQGLYRAAQEGLTNVQRHARATETWVDLDIDPAQVRLTVADNGVGIARGISGGQKPPGFGIAGLQERAAQLGGELRLEDRPEGGAQLTLTIPLIQEKIHA